MLRLQNDVAQTAGIWILSLHIPYHVYRYNGVKNMAFRSLPASFWADCHALYEEPFLKP
jgi:hypothetical protein